MTYSPTANKTPLSAYMQPSSPNLYPASDITSIVADTNDPAYSGQQTFSAFGGTLGSRYRFSYGSFYNLGGTGNGVNAINGATQSSTSSWTSFEVEFFVNGDRFAFWSVQGGAQSDYMIYVDDMPLTSDWMLNNATAYGVTYTKVQFATSRTRKVRILCSGFMSFTAILVPGTSDIWAANKRYRAAIIGDSYVQGGHNGGSEGYVMGAGMCNQIAIQTGWEVFNLGQGGTGYTNNGGNSNGKDVYGASSRMTALAALPSLDLIIVYGSGNDSSASSSTLTTAANSLWNAIKAARPTTPIVVAGMEPGSPTGFDTSLLDSSNVTLKTAAAANVNVSGFIDMRPSGDAWVTGTGNSGTPNDTGNQDFFICPDGVHPTRIGYQNMSTRMVRELKRIRV